MAQRVKVKQRVSAADIRAALITYYAPPAHRVFFEVSNDTGTKAKRWVDAIALGIWPSTGYEVVGIEIKVSRSDFRTELADPTKAQELMRFCTRWFLAAPAGMITPDELPATWGLLEYNGGVLRRKKVAPLLEAEAPTRGFMMAILRQANSVDQALVGKLVDERVKEMQASFDRRVENEVRYKSEDVTHRNKRAEEIVAEIEAVTGEKFESGYGLDREALSAAYLLLRETGLHRSNGGFRFHDLSSAADDMEKLSQKLRAVCEDERFAAVRDRLEQVREDGRKRKR